MNGGHQECPVCTLYLRPGISLKQHLETHPKDQVIEALLKLKDTSTGTASPGSVSQPQPALVQQTPQLTTAVTYQQILTTNSAGAVVPQFLQVPTYVNNTPYGLSQNMGFAPTLFNPLYNPYVPHPYHFGGSSQPETSQDKRPVSPVEEATEKNADVGSEMEMSEYSPPSDYVSPLSSLSPSPQPSVCTPSVIITRRPRSRTSLPRDPSPPQLTPCPDYELRLESANNSPESSPVSPVKEEDCMDVEVSNDEFKEEAAPSEEKKEEDVGVKAVSCTPNPCPNLPFDHEVIADLPSLQFEEPVPSSSCVDSKNSDPLLNQLNSETCNYGVANYDSKCVEEEEDLGFDYVDEAANFSAPGSSNVIYTDLLPSASPRLLHDLLPSTSPRLLQELMPASSSNAFMELDGLRIFFNNNGPVATASRVPSPPSVIQMADSTKKDPMPINITADESMPARGELSEQESLGADSAWGMFQPDVKVSPVWGTPDLKPLKCPMCPMAFACYKERRAHKLQVHMRPGKVFKCSTCGEIFTNLRDRRAHMAVHVDVKPVKLENGATAAQGAAEVTSTLRHCVACAKSLPSLKELRAHLREVHGQVRFKCEECSEGYDEETDFNNHLKIHPLKCGQCEKTFTRRSNLNLHMKRHLPVKPFECPLCPKSFVTRQKLEEHTNSHSGVRPIKCVLCDKTFSRHSNLIQHRNMHHGKGKKKMKDYVCRCGEVFHSQRKLDWHREIHENKPKSCPFCSQKFIHSASVTRHVRRSHMPGYLPTNNNSSTTRPDTENVSCPICDKVYLRSSLSVHMRVHNGVRPFQCKVCSKNFTTKWNMELHQWTHQSRSAMPYKCNLCKSAFFREADHIAHLNAHKNLKPFICNVCGQKFIRKYNCIRHQEEHQRAKKFACTVSGCQRTFHRSYYLKDHMKVHTGARPHTCHLCGKASSTKSNHNKHVRIHDTREMVNTEN